MAVETSTRLESNRNGWNDATLALLVGTAVFGVMVFFVAVTQPPEFPAPPLEAIPLFVFNTAAAAISYTLLARGNAWGYGVTLVTGLLVVISIVLIGTGTVGSLPSGGNPIGPLSYAGLGVALLVTTVLAWRKDSRSGTVAASTPAGE